LLIGYFRIFLVPGGGAAADKLGNRIVLHVFRLRTAARITLIVPRFA